MSDEEMNQAETLKTMAKDLEAMVGHVEELEEKIELISKFLKMQSSINNVLKYLVKRKYSDKELDKALKEFEEIENHLKNEEKDKKEDEKDEEKTVKSEKK